jgi:hypothetical protein
MKYLLLTFVLISCLYRPLHGQSNSPPPDLSKKEQEKKKIYLKRLEGENVVFRATQNSLTKENELLRKEIGSLYFSYYGTVWKGGLGPLSPPGTAPPNKGRSPNLGGNISLPSPSLPTIDLAVHQRQLKALNGQLASLKEDLEAARTASKSDREEFGLRIDQLTQANAKLTTDLASSERALKKAEVELEKSAALVRCTRKFYLENEKKRGAAKATLERARDKYDRYADLKRRNNTRYDAEIREILDFVFGTYEQYDDQPISQNCGDGIVIKDVISYMDARDHLNLATILASDPRHLINSYEGGVDQRTAAINADLIYHLSQVFAKQNSFDDLSMSKRIADKLPDLMQKVPNALASSSTLNPRDSSDQKIVYMYAYVAEAYSDKEYAKALGLYNRYQRLEGESHLSDKHEIKAATMTSVGLILLFDLGKVSGAKGIPLTGTFLEKSLSSQQKEGIILLKKVLSFRDEDGATYPEKSEVFKWQKRAAYAISKYYYPAGKRERQRNRDNKKLNQGKKLKENNGTEYLSDALEVEQSEPRRMTITPSLYPFVPIQQAFYQSSGEVGIELDGSGLEGSVRLDYYKPGKAFSYGLDLGYSQQYFRLENNSIRLPPASLSFGTAFGGPFVSFASRNIEKQFHPILSAGISFRYDIDRKFRLNDNDPFGDRRSILITDLPFFDRISWYANIGLGINREHFSLSKQRMVASTFRVFAFIPVFNTAAQVNNDPLAFGNRYSPNFLDLERQTIHLGVTYSKFIEVFKNGLGMSGSEMHFINNRNKKVRLLQPLVINNTASKRVDGKFSLLTNFQPSVDSVYLSADSSYTNINPSVGWRFAYNLHIMGNNHGFFNQSNGFAWKNLLLYDFFVSGGIQQQLYRLSIREQYRSFRTTTAFIEGGVRFGSNNLMLLLGGGYNIPLSNQAIYTNGAGVIEGIHEIHAFVGLQLAQSLLVRISTRTADIDGSDSLISLKNLNLQVGFGF